MKKIFTSQEILLVTNTKFSAKEYTDRESIQSGASTTNEKLAEACWNGMLTDRLPEISVKLDNKPLTMWELSEGVNVFYLQMGVMAGHPDSNETLNPYRIIECMSLN